MSHIDIKHHKHHKTVIGNSPYFRHLNLLQFLNPTGTLWCHVFVWRCTRACHVGSMLVPIFRDASPNLSKAKPARLWTCWTDSVKDVKLGAAGCFWNFWNSGYLMFLDLCPSFLLDPRRFGNQRFAAVRFWFHKGLAEQSEKASLAAVLQALSKPWGVRIC